MGGIVMLEQQNGRLVFSYDSELLWIEPWGENALRVRSTKMSEMPREDWALLPSHHGEARITVDPYGARIQNGKIRAELNTAGKIAFFNQKGEVILEEYVRNRKQYRFAPGEKPTGFASALDIEAREFKPILGGDYALSLRFESNPSERLYGMGQYQQAYLNLKGCDLELAQRNSQASVPFLLSSLGYGFLWNNPGVGRATFGKNMTTWQAVSTKALDYWICAGDTPA